MKRLVLHACFALAMSGVVPNAQAQAPAVSPSAPMVPAETVPAASAPVMGTSAAAAPVASGQAGAPGSALLPSSTKYLPFSRLGAFQPIHLTGVHGSDSVGVGVRLDRIVTGARLHLAYTYSPALLPAVSHIRVLFNQQAIATVPLNQHGVHDAGKLDTFDVALDPRMFTGFNQITLQLVGHYTLDHCEDPANTAIWADISPSSALILDEQPVVLSDDLSLLPAPFFDLHDNTRLVLPFMVGPAPDDGLLRSAGILASWFGNLAGYRGARFPAVASFPAANNAVLLTTPAHVPPSLHVGPIHGPTIMVRANPAAPGRKILLILGRNDEEIRNAVYGLVLGRAVLSGSSAEVGQVDIGPPRKPYDAPKWLPMNGPVKFKDMVSDPAQLQVSGSTPPPIRIEMPVPADLFEWSGRGIPLDLKYRYTAPSVTNDSMLNIDLNNLLVKSYRLSPRSPEKSAPEVGTLRLPMLSDNGSGMSDLIDIPSFRVGSANEMELSFSLDSQKSGLCTGVSNNPARAAVDPNSTIDFSGLAHYAVMPNLAFFVNSGYPYTRLADLADTVVVIPDHPDATDIETMLEILGRMGNWTGLPSLRVGVMRASQVKAPLDKDLIVIGSGNTASLMKGWNDASPLRITGHVSGGADRHGGYTVSLAGRGTNPPEGAREHAVELGQDGSLGAIVGMESPFHEKRSVVAFVGTDPGSLRDVSRALADPGASKFISGDVAIVRGREVQAMRVGPQYSVGYLPWYARTWMLAAAHPLLLAVLSVLAGILVAMGLFVGLQSVAARRRRG